MGASVTLNLVLQEIAVILIYLLPACLLQFGLQHASYLLTYIYGNGKYIRNARRVDNLNLVSNLLALHRKIICCAVFQ
jgi:hypothetical protein